MNPDGVANMAIAENLFNGNLNYAINAYWSLLFPTLIAFGKIFSGNFLLAAKVANAICAVWVLYQSRLIILKLIPSKFTRFCVLLALVSILLKNALLIITADLLFLAIALNILYLLAFKDGKQKLPDMILLGILGAALYLTKSYGFPFFIAIILTKIALDFLIQKNKLIQLATNMGIVLSFFLLLVITWVICLYNKYNFFTLGTSGNYNAQIISFVTPGQVMNRSMILGPSFDYNYSIWDDVSCIQFNKTLSPLFNIFNFQYMQLVLKNLIKSSFYSLLFLSLPAFLTACFSAENKKLFLQKHQWCVYFILICFIQVLSYSLIIVEIRYFLLSAILSGIVIVYFIDKIPFKLVKTKMAFQLVFLCLLIYSQIYNLIIYKNVGKEMFEDGIAMKKYLSGARFASVNNWEAGYYLSFLTGSKFYGNLSPNSMTMENIFFQTEPYNIKYLVYWNYPLKTTPTLEYKNINLLYKNERLSLFQINNDSKNINE
jgi:hypothetical protein